MSRLLGWLDDRTGYRALMHEALFERIPGGSRWRYVWGSTLVFAFVTQVVTGMFLWMAYSPSAQTAWESVFFLQHEMQGGWLLRGVHHFMAQAMIVLLALHLMQVVIDGAYRAPREVNFWVGLILMKIVLGLSLTGYLLPLDQKGYWATKVATNIMGVVPVVGPSLQRLAVGGGAYGHQTLTRFFALHAGVLPALLVLLLAVHIYVFRRHGIHTRYPTAQPDCSFWPDQLFKDAVACLAVLAVVLGLVIWLRGAELGAPADPANPYSAARPEWYFLFLFQFLKYFHGETEVVGAVVIPGIVLGILFLMPLVGRWKLGHGFNILFLFALLVGISLLTAQAWKDDYYNANFQDASLAAQRNAERAVVLATEIGIPPEGTVALMRNDPATAGPLLFEQSCAACHLYVGAPGQLDFKPKEPRGSNLAGFASRQWIAGLLSPEGIHSENYFGNTEHREGEMATWVTENVPDIAPDQLAKVVAALSAQAELPLQREIDARDAQQVVEGVALIKNRLGCTDCHRFQEAGEEGTAPDLTDYGSRTWLMAFIKNPGAKSFYGDEHQMPAFEHQRSEREIGLIADFLRHDWVREDGDAAPEMLTPVAGK